MLKDKIFFGVSFLAKLLFTFKIKSIVFALLGSVLVYFNIEHFNMQLLLQGEKEVTIQKNIIVETRRFKSVGERRLEYVVSNVGSEPVDFIVKAKHEEDSPSFITPYVFRLFANEADMQMVAIRGIRPFHTRVNIRVSNLEPGLGVAFKFKENKKILDYWSSFEVEAAFKDADFVYQHNNKSPFSIWAQRFVVTVFLMLFFVSFVVNVFQLLFTEQHVDMSS
jgi:hypothetical protein